jgi:hypothetical protein
VESHFKGDVFLGYIVVVRRHALKHKLLVFWREELAVFRELWACSMLAMFRGNYRVTYMAGKVAMLTKMVTQPSIMKILRKELVTNPRSHLYHCLPSPSTVARSAVHLRNQRRQESVDRTCDNTCRKEQDVSRQVFRLGVVRANQVGGARDEGRLSHALKQATDDKLLPFLYHTTSNDCDTPEEHHDTQTLWSILLENDLHRNARNKVSEVEDPNSNVETLASEMQFLFHSLNLCISNICTVK